MLFNSYGFIVIFLPLVCAVYYLCNHFKWYKVAQGSLIVASFLFFGYENYKLCLLLFTSILVNYLLHVIMVDKMKRPKVKKWGVALGLLFNFGLLFYFKYFTFVVSNLNRFLETDFVLKNIVLPLGISFFTFQQVSFIIDSGREDMVRYSFLDYALFVAFFPQLVAGPIVLHQEMIHQFGDVSKKSVNLQNMTEGIEYFIIGLAKKVLVADSFARICDAGLENLSALNSLSAVLTMLAFTIQIYFDFSGYCDMAIGLGKMFNIEIPKNFDAPYKAHTIDEFWKNWHITLSRFLTTYLYVPLGGNRRGRGMTYINIMIVFTLSGLWHGADWNYILWGVLHGIMKVIYRLGKKWWDRLPKVLLWLSTFSFVNIAWTFFRADYFSQPFELFRQVTDGGGGALHESMVSAFTENSLLYVVVDALPIVAGSFATGQVLSVLWYVVALGICVCLPTSHQIVSRRKGTRAYIWLGCLFVWSFVGLSQISKFIYFNF